MARAAQRLDGVDARSISDRTDYWRALIDALDQAIIVTNADGIIVEFNAAAEQLTGYLARDVLEQLPLAALYDGHEIAARARELSLERGEWLEPGFATLVAAGQALPEREWTLVLEDGRRVAVGVAWRALRGALGTLEACLVLPRERRAAPRPASAAPAALEGQGGTGSPAPADPCFAPDDALRRLDGDRALLVEVAGLFQSDRFALAADIQRGVDERDPDAIQRGAHRLRSALLNLAAGPAARAALSLEESGRRGCVPQPEQVALLFTELERLSVALSRFRGAAP